jgi:hypothetical protein
MNTNKVNQPTVYAQNVVSQPIIGTACYDWTFNDIVL